MKKIYLFLIVLIAFNVSSIAQNGSGAGTLADPYIIDDFPYTFTNFSSSNGETADGMQGNCPQLPCCSTKVFKVTVPENGALRADMSNYVQLTGSIIAYKATTEPPADFSDLLYVHAQPGNFCGFRDTLHLGYSYTWDRYYTHLAANDSRNVGWSSDTDFGVEPDVINAGVYYLLVFTENNQAGMNEGGITDIHFRFAPACQAISQYSDFTFDPQELNTTMQQSFWLYNTADSAFAIDMGNLPTVSGDAAADFTFISVSNDSILPNDSIEVVVEFTPTAAGDRVASLDFTLTAPQCAESASFELTGVGAFADLDVAYNNSSLANGGSINVGAALINQTSVTKFVWITNTGGDTLDINNLGLTGSVDFTISTQPDANVLPDSTTQIGITFAPTTGGSASVTVSFDNNTGNNNPFAFTVNGSGVEPNAMHFDGSGDYVRIDDVAPVMAGEKVFSIEAWIKADPTQTGNDHIVSAHTSGNTTRILFRLDDGILDVYNNDVSYEFGTQDLRDGQWHHVAITTDDETTRGYVDGVLLRTIDTGFPALSSTNKWSIGQEWDNGGASEYFKGAIDEVRIWKDVRTPEEIAGLRFCELVGDEEDLVAYYSFNQGVTDGDNSSETQLTDFGPNGLHGTLHGLALNGTSSNFVAGDGVVAGCESSVQFGCNSESFTSDGGTEYTNEGIVTENINGVDHKMDVVLPFQVFTINTIADQTTCEGDTQQFFLETNMVQPAVFTKADETYVNIDPLTPAIAEKDRSIFLWMKKSTQISGSTQALFAINAANGDNVCNLQIGTNEKLEVYDGANAKSTGVVVTDGEWHHVGYTYNNTTFATVIYINGDSVYGYTNNQEVELTDVVSLGQEYDNILTTSNFYDGLMAEITVWDTLLTNDAIANLAANAPMPNAAGLVAYYPGNAACSAGEVTLEDIAGTYSGVASDTTILVNDTTSISQYNSFNRFEATLIADGSTLQTLDGNLYTNGEVGVINLELTLNGSGVSASTTFTSTVQPAPVITNQPHADWVIEGDDVTFTVATDNDGAYDFQWCEIGPGISITNKTQADGLVSNTIVQVLESNGTLYVGTTAGLSISTDGGQSFVTKTTADGLGDNRCLELYESNGILYVGTSQGLSISTDGGNTFVNKTPAPGGNNWSTGIHESNGVIYLTTGGGLAISTDGGNTFVNKTASDGLASSTCQGVYASNGTLYVCTSQGLSISTDGGNTFVTKTTADGLASNSCASVYESNGTLYVGTSQGLSISTDGGNTFVTKTTANGLGGNYCEAVYESNGFIYVATDMGVSISTDGGNTFVTKTTADGLENNYCNDVYESNGLVYVATIEGLSILTNTLTLAGETNASLNFTNVDNSLDSTHYQVKVTDPVNGCSTSSDMVSIIINHFSTSSYAISACGEYIVPSGDETYLVDGIYMDTIPNALGFDSIMTIDVTINPLPVITSQPQNSVVLAGEDATFNVVTDNNGGYDFQWYKIRDESLTNKTTADGLGGNICKAVYESNGTLYVGTNGGLSISTDGGDTFENKTTVDGLGNNNGDVVYESNGTLYVGSGHGLSISTDGGNTFVNKTTVDGLPSNTCRSVYESSGTLYVGTNGGLSISIDGGNTFVNKTTADGLPSNTCRSVYESNGTLYVTTTGGLSISTDGGNTFVNKTTADGLGIGTYYGVYESNGVIYVAAFGGLSISTDGGNTFVNKTASDGLGGNTCNAVYESNGTLYVATIGGLSISTDGGNSFENKTTADGLVHNFCNAVYESNGMLYVATQGGLSILTNSFKLQGETTPDLTISNIDSESDSCSYYVVITDPNTGCYATSDSAMAVIGTPCNLTATVESGENFGATYQEAQVQTTGGIGNITYLWSNGETTQAVAGLSEGNYTVTATDDGASETCTAIANYTVENPVACTLSITASATDATINGVANGDATATVGGEQGSLTYTWYAANNPGFAMPQTGATITGLSADIYTVEVNDDISSSCNITATVTVSEPSCALSVTASSTDVSCNGLTDGTLAATAAGFVSTVTYQWNNEATTETQSGVAAGVYTITIIEGACMASASTTVSEPSSVAVTVAPVQTGTCGAADANATAIATGGPTSNYTYLWENGQTTATATGLNAATHGVTVSSNACAQATVAAVSDPQITVTRGTEVGVVCEGENNGQATVNVTGGTPSNYTYNWSNGETTATASALTAGDHFVTVTEGGCVGTMDFEIDDADPFFVQATQVNVECRGASTGSVSWFSPGGYTYHWDNGSTTEELTGLPEGIYHTTVTDEDMCNKYYAFTITEPATGISTTITCGEESAVGASDATSSVAASGGVTPYSYNWSNGSPYQTASDLSEGDVFVTITDASGCTQVNSCSVTLNPCASLTLSSTVTDISCYGASDGAIAVEATGGSETSYSYTWSNSSSGTTISDLGNPFYGVTVTSGTCELSETFIINEPAELSVSIAVNNHVSCFGGSNAMATANRVGGAAPFAYVWNNGETTTTATALSVGEVSVTLTSGGCTAEATATVSEPATALVTSGTETHVDCNGNATGSIDLSVSGGVNPYSYQWSNNVTAQDQNGVVAGNYDVTITDNSGCSSVLNFFIDEPNNLAVAAVVNNNASCNGALDGELLANVTGGTTNYSYLWNNGETTASLTGLGAESYSVTVTDANGCSASKSANITEPSAITITTDGTNPSVCAAADGSVSVTGAVGGPGISYTYEWENGVTTATNTGITAGYHTVSVTVGGCTETAVAAISDPSGIQVTLTPTHNLCYGETNGEIEVAINGGTTPYVFDWSNGSTDATATGLAAGQHFVTITSGGNCNDYLDGVIIDEPALLAIASTETQVACNGGSNGAIDLTITGGVTDYTFNWNNSQTTEDLIGLTAGTYAVTVTDNNGCTETDTYVITEPSAIIATIACNATSGAGNPDGSSSVSATGGTMPYTYSWNNGETTASITGLFSGIVEVTVTDANGCTAEESCSITDDPCANLAATTTVTNVTCNGSSNGLAVAQGSGGTSTNYTYAWSNGSVVSTATGLAAGTYTVTVGVDFCPTIVESVTVEEPTLFYVATDYYVSVSCNGGSDGEFGVTAYGGSSTYSYMWDNGQTTATATGLSVGEYSVTTSETGGCAPYQHTVTISEPSAITVTQTCVATTGAGNSDGSSTIAAMGGISPYTYMWDNGTTTDNNTGLFSGLIQVTVTDNNGCVAINDCTVEDDPCANVALSTSITNVSCFAETDGTAIAEMTDGFSTDFTYNWSTTEVVDSIGDLSAGNYMVTIEDGNNCSVTGVVTITQPALITATDVITICDNDSASIGGAYYNTAGVYTKTETAVNGCDSIVDVTLVVNPTYYNESTIDICNGDSALVFGTYQTDVGVYWDSLQTTVGCDSVFKINLNVFSIPEISITADSHVCEDGAAIPLSATPAGGTFSGTGVAGNSFDPTVPSTGDVTISYAFTTTDGCVTTNSAVINVVELPEVTLGAFADTICIEEELVACPTGEPANGVYSGNGVNGFIFETETAGVGTHTVTYTYTDQYGCISSDIADAIVVECYPPVDTTINMLNNVTFSDMDVAVYPNPTKGDVILEMINFELNQQAQVTITNAVGQLVYQSNITNPTLNISLNEPSGVYYIQLTNKEATVVKQLIIK